MCKPCFSKGTFMNDKIKNIWVLCHYAQQPPYNTMLRYHNWGKQLVKRGYTVKIVAASTVHNTEIDVIEKIKSDQSVCEGINYKYLSTSQYYGNGVGRMKNMLEFCLKLRKLKCCKERPDVIIICGAYLYLFVRHYFRNIPIITDIVDLWPASIIEYSNVSEKNLLVQILYQVEKAAYIKTDALIFSMEGGKDYVRERKYSKKVAENKIFHINMGIDLTEADRNRAAVDLVLPWNMDKKNIVYIGSVRKANNVQQICDAALELQKRGICDVEFQIYGNGDELDSLIKYCKEKKIHNIFFYGRIEKSKIPFILEHSTANILTYKQVHLMKYGGSQSKLFDYLASGKPIICNAKFGYNLIERYNCGLVTENQTSKAFANTVERLCALSEAELNLMGKRARQAAEEYDQPKLVNRLCSIFEYLNKRKEAGNEQNDSIC